MHNFMIFVRVITEKSIMYRKKSKKGRIDLMDLSNNMLYQLGVEAGRKQMMDHIQHQCSIGKPVECNGELYFFKTAQQNLMDIMDDIDNAWNEEHGEKRFIVPIRMFHNTSTDVRELLVKADDPETAMLIAKGDFQHNGWIVDDDYENYKQVK